MAQITKRDATQSIFDKTALQELLPFDRITEMQCWCYVPLRALTGAPGGMELRGTRKEQIENDAICKQYDFNPMPPS